MSSELFTTIKEIALTIGIIFPNLTLLWKVWKERKKVDPKVRLIRNKALQEKIKVQGKAEIARIEIWREAKLTKLQIEEAAIEEEIKHFARIRNIENGVSETPKEQSTDFLTTLTQQGKSFLKDKVGSVGELLGKKEKK